MPSTRTTSGTTTITSTVYKVHATNGPTPEPPATNNTDNDNNGGNSTVTYFAIVLSVVVLIVGVLLCTGVLDPLIARIKRLLRLKRPPPLPPQPQPQQQRGTQAPTPPPPFPGRADDIPLQYIGPRPPAYTRAPSDLESAHSADALLGISRRECDEEAAPVRSTKTQASHTRFDSGIGRIPEAVQEAVTDQQGESSSRQSQSQSQIEKQIAPLRNSNSNEEGNSERASSQTPNRVIFPSALDGPRTEVTPQQAQGEIVNANPFADLCNRGLGHNGEPGGKIVHFRSAGGLTFNGPWSNVPLEETQDENANPFADPVNMTMGPQVADEEGEAASQASSQNSSTEATASATRKRKLKTKALAKIREEFRSAHK